MTVKETETSLPERFQVARRTLLMDRFMNRSIQLGGVAVVAAVGAIFLFILWQIFPLFQGADVRPLQNVRLAGGNIPELTGGSIRLIGTDEWTELPFAVKENGDLVFFDLAGVRGVFVERPPFEGPAGITAVSYNQEKQVLTYGTDDGRVALVHLHYEPRFENGERTIVQNLQADPFVPVGRRGAPVRDVSFGDAGERKLLAAIQEGPRGPEVHAVLLSQEEDFFGVGELRVEGTFDLTPFVEGVPVRVLVKKQADALVVLTRDHRVHSVYFADGVPELRQVFRPFGDLEDPTVASMDYLFGDVSLVFTHPSGANRIFSLYVPEGEDRRLYGHTKTLDPLSGGAEFYAKSVRNKAYLVGRGPYASLRYATTGKVRWEETLPFRVRHAVVSGKYDRIVFLDEANRMRVYALEDPHPEAGFQAFFGKLWYEGYAHPCYEWQSTGGTDDFEPKLSMVPLLIGSLKGTFYALVFAVPVALLAALYTSQFLHPDWKIYVKPVMEIMASLPSVVLGFLAALYIAPLIEKKVPSLLLALVAVPGAAVAFGAWWSSRPIQWRNKVKGGFEYLMMVPLFLLVFWACWEAGPLVERLLFTITDPATGQRVADFRLWWPLVTGTPFEQRNSLVVGFMMGFAVMPIIFTIAEDSLSNVPESLRSASLALGASRWQTAVRVVLPTAAAGIFSAVMIGFGRAVGETMIVLMATGNTPIMDFNIFTGMRTLSANIAVELPEAPAEGTLYRALFLGGMVLFLMTFAVNTLAEVMRQHLREKYKTI